MHATLLAATGVAALTNWSAKLRPNDALEKWSKPLTTILVIGLALASGAPGARVAVAVAALALCLAGDVALLPSVDRFVAGLAAFLLGHLLFIVLFAMYGLHHPALAGVALLLALALIASVGRIVVLRAGAADAALRVPVAAYLVVISSMAVCGWATGRGLVIAGATLFVASDAVLGWRQFVRERPWMSLAVMVTYHAAIVCLALSLW
jgi:uncharacterized membrane protein YhhN